MSSPEARPVEPHYSLEDAAARFFPGGTITKRSLQTEIDKGRLRAVKLAGKYVVSEGAIREMIEKATSCQDQQNLPGSTSVRRRVVQPSGSSCTVDANSAQDAVKATLQALKKRCANTSAKPMSHRPARGR